MIPPNNCPYKGLSAPPCWRCNHFIADTYDCKLKYYATIEVNHTGTQNVSVAFSAPTYEEKLRQYEEDRKKLLELSKEALVDLLLHKPEMF